MDPLVMVGAWAAALLAIAGAGRLLWQGFSRTVRAIIREELGRVWKDQDDIEARLSALELSLRFVREQLEELRRMMQDHIKDKDV